MSKQDPPRVFRVNGWDFDSGLPARRSRVAVAGIFLICLGLLLGLGQLYPDARIGASAFFLAVGVALVAIGIRDRSNLALYAGVVVTAIALSNMLSGMGRIDGPGWGTLFLGVGVTAIALFRSTAGRRLGWTLGIGLLLVLWGGGDVVASRLQFPADRLIGPLLIVLLGLYIVSRSRGFGPR
jgi:hypothetical protein